MIYVNILIVAVMVLSGLAGHASRNQMTIVVGLFVALLVLADGMIWFVYNWNLDVLQVLLLAGLIVGLIGYSIKRPE